MMTELQQNFDKIRKRMLSKYNEKDELFHYPPCIVPAWEPLIDEIIALVEEWNDTEPENHALRIFQMKEKFGMFVVYLEPANGNGVVCVPDSIRDAVNKIANEGIKICRVCGERKIQTVV
ncbi:MAG: hypothetical protein VX514_08915, partial [Candidatus Thermoplasmatota archaeon]|nr:hypothetical protein [Candidatus Thermoplasmatota archaeon]